MAAVERFLSALWDLLKHPTSNITAAMLLAAVIAILLISTIVGILMLLASGSEEEEEEPEEATARRRRELEVRELDPATRKRRLLEATVILAVTLVVSVVAFGWASGTDRFCADQCHQVGKGLASQDASVLGQDGSHDRESCISCHETGGPLSMPARLTGRTQHTVTSYLGWKVTGIRTPVQSSACLACHDDVLRRSVESTEAGVRMSHKQPAEKGAACTDCHRFAGHDGEPDIGMGLCLRCHDGKVASTKCDTCHTRDTSSSISDAQKIRVFAKVTLSPARDCEGCHSSEKCDKCHGLRMPHSADFRKFGHARQAAFERKQVCWRCHVPHDCSNCHENPTENKVWGHIYTWRSVHGNGGAPRMCGCHQNPANMSGNFCAACH